MLFAMPENYKTPIDLVRLWMHEANRVYRDKLVEEKDLETFDKLVKDFSKKAFEVCIQIELCCCLICDKFGKAVNV